MKLNAALLCTVLSAISGQASAQTQLYGITASGNLVRIDKATGAGVIVGPIGFGAGNAASGDPQGRIFTHSSASDQLILVDPATGAGSLFLTLTGRPGGYGIRGMAFSPQGDLFVALSQSTTSIIDTLAKIDLTTGAYTVVGPTGRTDIQGLAFSPSGTLYTAGIAGGLYTLDPSTGAATVIGGGFSGDDQALEFDTDGTLFSARDNLRSVNPATGAATLIGAIGVPDIRGLAITGGAAPCYANCDASTSPPVLNVNDFTCFLNRFAAGDSNANCDASTNPPVLNVNDFTCFLNLFAAGCP
jgi:hypothetical protein